MTTYQMFMLIFMGLLTGTVIGKLHTIDDTLDLLLATERAQTEAFTAIL